MKILLEININNLLIRFKYKNKNVIFEKIKKINFIKK